MKEFLLQAALGFVVGTILVFGINEGMQHKYDEGKRDGIAEQTRIQEKAAVREKERKDEEKNKIELVAQSKIAAAEADAAFARSTADRLRGEIERIRNSILQETGAQPASESGRATIVLLADLFEKSSKRNEQLAQFADHAYNAAKTCEAQYNSL